MLGHYLMFNRNCEEALKTYESAFDARVEEIQTYGSMPPNPNFVIPDSDKHLVLHARLKVCDTELMCADSAQHATLGDNMYITVNTQDEALVKKAWAVLAREGQVLLELSPSFFSRLHGSLKDKFGINWMFTVMK